MNKQGRVNDDLKLNNNLRNDIQDNSKILSRGIPDFTDI